MKTPSPPSLVEATKATSASLATGEEKATKVVAVPEAPGTAPGTAMVESATTVSAAPPAAGQVDPAAGKCAR